MCAITHCILHALQSAITMVPGDSHGDPLQALSKESSARRSDLIYMRWFQNPFQNQQEYQSNWIMSPFFAG